MAGKKRKRAAGVGSKERGTTIQDRVGSLEAGIIESRTNYNDIVELQEIAENTSHPKESVTAVVALCRVYCVLLAGGDMLKDKRTAASEAVLVDWLKEQYAAYCGLLLRLVTSDGTDATLKEAIVKLVMRLVKEEAASANHDHVWRHGLFAQFVQALISQPATSQPALKVFLAGYANVFDDVRYYTFRAAASLTSESGITNSQQPADSEMPGDGRLSLLLGIGTPVPADQLTFLVHETKGSKHVLSSPSKHKKQAQEAWVAILKSELDTSQRKEVLARLTQRVAPWFLQVDFLADFLTDSYNTGGATSLLALSGIYHLIQERNLDYPSFYMKLYSLLDEGLLHSKHRSRFFRHLEVFMSSSHLPAALVASFVKRLARLSLSAPPAGIIAVCPWIYNMLKAHPQCAFMIQRETQDRGMSRHLEEQGIDDPFNMDEVDPLITGAIDSSLWEIETLQSHYHPNVASLAKIISEQFTKQAYKMEDFLDYSYASIIDADLDKGMKKTPVTEWQIPKHIFTSEDGNLNAFGTLLQQVRQHS